MPFDGCYDHACLGHVISSNGCYSHVCLGCVI